MPVVSQGPVEKTSGVFGGRKRYRSSLAIVVVLALVSVFFVGVDGARGATFGTLTITTDTDLFETHVGNIVIGADGVSLDCRDNFVVATSVDSVGILVDGRTDVTIRNCQFTGFSGSAIRIENSHSTTLERNVALANAGDGFFATDSPSTVFRENTANGNGSAGFEMELSSGSRFTDNLALNNAVGFHIDRSGNVTLRNNRASGSSTSAGFSFALMSGAVLVGNIATSNNIGFNLDSPTAAFEVRRNLATGNNTGFSLEGHSDSVFRENTSAFNSRTGFQLTTSRNNLFTGNTTLENRTGFSLLNSSDDNVFARNNIVGNDTQAATSFDSQSVWYDLVALEGNFWSDYRGLDDGSGTGVAGDGIGDTHIPHPGPGFDPYPLMTAVPDPFAVTARDDDYKTDEDTKLTVAAPGVLDNDDVGAVGSLAASLSSGPSHGQLTLNPNGSFTYTPSLNYCGSDGFRYVADNGYLPSEEATVEIDVNCVNDIPTADPGGPYFVDEGSSISLDGSGSTDVEDVIGDLTLEWDLDYQAATPDFGETGLSPTFDATSVDGPSAFDIALRVTDSGGAQNIATTSVTVLNLAPTVTVDDPGLLLPGIEFELSASFSDFALDTHTASIDWGDGTTSDLGAVLAPQILAAQTYAATGTYDIEVSVTDDDGGTGSYICTVEVVDAETAVAATAEDLANLAGSESDPTIGTLINDALEDLVGSDTDNSGALDKLTDGDIEAAMAKMLKAAQSLEEATTEGASDDVTDTLKQLSLIARLIAEDQYTQAVQALDPPSRGEQKQLNRITSDLDEALDLIATGEYAEAIDIYADAVKRALAIMP